MSEIVSKNDTSVILSQTPEPFFTLSVPIPNKTIYPTLYDCIDEHVKGDILEGENGWFNEETNKKQDVIKRITYWGFPNILCIDLKRFDSKNKKKQIPVAFPLEDLDLRKYVIGYNKETFIYDLYGVCNHSGNVNGGHYTAHVKNGDGQWYEYNDTRVIRLSNPSSIVSAKAYCLFYRKKSAV